MPRTPPSGSDLARYAAALSEAVDRSISPHDLLVDRVHRMPFLGRRARRELVEAFGARCLYCYREGTSDLDADHRKWNPDHFIPRSKYGSSHPSNVVLACHFCNNEKWDSLWLPGHLFPSSRLEAFRADVELREARRAVAKAKKLRSSPRS